MLVTNQISELATCSSLAMVAWSHSEQKWNESSDCYPTKKSKSRNIRITILGIKKTLKENSLSEWFFREFWKFTENLRKKHSTRNFCICSVIFQNSRKIHGKFTRRVNCLWIFCTFSVKFPWIFKKHWTITQWVNFLLNF